MEKKEYMIGEVLEFEGGTYECVKGLLCDDCAVSKGCYNFVCSAEFRSDGKYVGYKEITKKPSTIDWEQRRYELAKAAMQGVLADHTVDNTDKILCEACIKLADEMINQLKQK